MKAILMTALLTTATTTGASAQTTRYNCMHYPNGQTFCSELGPSLPRNQMDQRLFHNDPRRSQNDPQQFRNSGEETDED
jgi:hypothetical protein